MQTRRRMPSHGGRPVAMAGSTWVQTTAGGPINRLTEAHSNTNVQCIPHSSSITTSINIQQSNAFSFSTPDNNNSNSNNSNNDSTLKMADRSEKDLVNHTDWNRPYLKYPNTSKDGSVSWNAAGNSTSARTVATVAGADGPFLCRRPAVISPYALDASSSHPNIYSCVSTEAVDDHCDTTSNTSNISSVTGDDDNGAPFQGAATTEKGLSRVAILPDFVIGAESPSTQKLRPRRKVTSCYDDDFQEERENKNEEQSHNHKGNERDERNIHLLHTLKAKEVHASSMDSQQENEQELLQENQEKYHHQEEQNLASQSPPSFPHSFNCAPAGTARTETNNFRQFLKKTDPEVLLHYGALALVRLNKSNEQKCQQFLETLHHRSVGANGVSLDSPSFLSPPPSLLANPLSATTIQQANNNLTSSQEVTSSLPEIMTSETRSLRSNQTPKENPKRKNNNFMSNVASKKQRNNKETLLSSCNVKSSQVQQKCPSRLAMPQDPEYLNSLHCFVRSELLELFCCTYDNNRVGLRCVSCGTQKKTNSNNKKKKKTPTPNFGTTPLSSSASPMAEMQDTPKMTKMSTFYPKSLSDLYRNVCAWQQKHFRTCPYIPRSVRDEYAKLKLQDKSRGKTRYWATSARALGLVDNNTTATANTNCRALNVATNDDELCMSTTPQRGDIDNKISVGVRFVGYNHNTD